MIWGGWGADWPSAITVIPPLFDSRPNLTPKAPNGQDYGNYNERRVQRADRRRRSAATARRPDRSALQEADNVLGQDVAYIPLEITKFYFLHGSKVTELHATRPPSAMYPDLGADRRLEVTE